MALLRECHTTGTAATSISLVPALIIYFLVSVLNLTFIDGNEWLVNKCDECQKWVKLKDTNFLKTFPNNT